MTSPTPPRKSSPTQSGLNTPTQIGNPSPPGAVMQSSSHNIKDQTPEPQTSPGEPLEDYEWQQLVQRYEDEMRKKTAEEAKLLADFTGLMNYFNAWASAMQHHESERAAKRLKTRISYVQHSEHQLEERRQHYLKVVEAFQNFVYMASIRAEHAVQRLHSRISTISMNSRDTDGRMALNITHVKQKVLPLKDDTKAEQKPEIGQGGCCVIQ